MQLDYSSGKWVSAACISPTNTNVYFAFIYFQREKKESIRKTIWSHGTASTEPGPRQVSARERVTVTQVRRR